MRSLLVAVFVPALCVCASAPFDHARAERVMQAPVGTPLPSVYSKINLPGSSSASQDAATKTIGAIIEQVCLPWVLEGRAPSSVLKKLGAKLVDNPLVKTVRPGLYPAKAYTLEAAPRILFWTEDAGDTSYLHCMVRSWDGDYDLELHDAFVAAGGASAASPSFSALKNADFERDMERAGHKVFFMAGQTDAARDGVGLMLYLNSSLGASKSGKH